MENEDSRFVACLLNKCPLISRFQSGGRGRVFFESDPGIAGSRAKRLKEIAGSHLRLCMLSWGSNPRMKTHLFCLFALAAVLIPTSSFGDIPPPRKPERPGGKLNLLIIDGQNNHAWKETSPVLKSIFENSGWFKVNVSTSPPALPGAPRMPKGDDSAKLDAYKKEHAKWQADVEKAKRMNQIAWNSWRPAFSNYDVVVSNYNGELWPKAIQEQFEAYVSGGGGFVAVHAANNSFPQWKAYNEMIGVGGWGGRSELSGPYLRLREDRFVNDMTPGRGGSHGARHEFHVETRAPEHPIMKGMLPKWLHMEDELYDRLRGPAKNVTVLASAFSDLSTKGSGEHEPILMTISYGSGRVFHTTLGHSTVSMGSPGFRVTLIRGAEWAAKGSVTFPAKGL